MHFYPVKSKTSRVSTNLKSSITFIANKQTNILAMSHRSRPPRWYMQYFVSWDYSTVAGLDKDTDGKGAGLCWL